MKVVEEAGDSQVLKAGQIVSARKLREENSRLRRKDLKTVEAREAVPATVSNVFKVLLELHYKLTVGYLLPPSRNYQSS